MKFIHTSFIPERQAPLSHRITQILAALSVIATAAIRAPHASACDTPVFRYALENWPASYYELLVLQRGPLSMEQEKIVARVQHAADNEDSPMNLSVRALDVENSPEGRQRWLQAGKPATPRMILRYPAELEIENPAWSGPLTEKNATAVLESPLRKQIAQRILGGDTAVWVFLEGADADQNKEAKTLLEDTLNEVVKSIQASDLEEGGAQAAEVEEAGQNADSTSPAQPLRFSVLPMSRTDAAESVLISTLLNTEPDLQGFTTQPIAFPVFGQGRALFALVGAGITDENIAGACGFLAGACSCQAKAMNPGIDIPMAANWESAVTGLEEAEALAPPLVGLATVAEAAATSAVADPAPNAAAALAANASSPGGLLASLLRNVAIVVAVFVAVNMIVLSRIRKKRV